MEGQPERQYSKYIQQEQKHTWKTTMTLTDYGYNKSYPCTENICAYLQQYQTSKTYSQKAALDVLYQTLPFWHNQQVFQDTRS